MDIGTSATFKMAVAAFVLLLVVIRSGNAADCTNALQDLEKVEEEMIALQNNLCSQARSFIDRILEYEQCKESNVMTKSAELWDQVSRRCPDSVKEADNDKPYACRKEFCMITPDMDGEHNATQSEGGEFEFDDVPTNLLRKLLSAFQGNSGRTRQATNGPKTLFDNNLLIIGGLIVDGQAQSGDFDPIAVCDALNELDVERMLGCFIDQKVTLKCDGEPNPGIAAYNVSSNARKLRDICSKACINIPPGPFLTCRSQMTYRSHLQAIEAAVPYGVEEACSNVQENYFNCLSNASRCCDPLLQELDLEYTFFMNAQYGGQTCSETKLNKMTNCEELKEDESEDTNGDDHSGDNNGEDNGSKNENDNDNDNGNGNGDGGNNSPSTGDGNSAGGVRWSPWMSLLLLAAILK